MKIVNQFEKNNLNFKKFNLMKIIKDKNKFTWLYKSLNMNNITYQIIIK